MLKNFNNLKKVFIIVLIFKHFDLKIENIVKIHVFDERLKKIILI